MTKHVLLYKKTAELLLGIRISFMDNESIDMGITQGGYTLSMIQHDGYIMYHPKTGEFWYFMNRKWVEDNFIDLGTL